MKEEIRPYAAITAVLLLIIGLYLLGHAGANWLGSRSYSNVGSEGQGILLSMRNTAMLQLIFGIATLILGFFIFLMLRHGSELEETG